MILTLCARRQDEGQAGLTLSCLLDFLGPATSWCARFGIASWLEIVACITNCVKLNLQGPRQGAGGKPGSSQRLKGLYLLRIESFTLVGAASCRSYQKNKESSHRKISTLKSLALRDDAKRAQAALSPAREHGVVGFEQRRQRIHPLTDAGLGQKSLLHKGPGALPCRSVPVQEIQIK
jgi:hypothetical protein